MNRIEVTAIHFALETRHFLCHCLSIFAAQNGNKINLVSFAKSVVTVIVFKGENWFSGLRLNL